jgi:septal ring factor EnvC (AmiA/AmiB activator)
MLMSGFIAKDAKLLFIRRRAKLIKSARIVDWIIQMIKMNARSVRIRRRNRNPRKKEGAGMPYGSSDDLNEAWDEIRALKSKIIGLDKDIANANETIRELRADKTRLEKIIDEAQKDGSIRAPIVFSNAPGVHAQR